MRRRTKAVRSGRSDFVGGAGRLVQLQDEGRRRPGAAGARPRRRAEGSASAALATAPEGLTRRRRKDGRAEGRPRTRRPEEIAESPPLSRVGRDHEGSRWRDADARDDSTGSARSCRPTLCPRARFPRGASSAPDAGGRSPYYFAVGDETSYEASARKPEPRMIMRPRWRARKPSRARLGKQAETRVGGKCPGGTAESRRRGRRSRTAERAATGRGQRSSSGHGAGVFSARVSRLAPRRLHRIVVGYDVISRGSANDYRVTARPPRRAARSAVVDISVDDARAMIFAPEVAGSVAGSRRRFHLENPQASTRIAVRLANPGAPLLVGADERPARTSPRALSRAAADRRGRRATPRCSGRHRLSSNPDRFKVWLAKAAARA